MDENRTASGTALRILKWAGFAVAGIIFLVVALLCVGTWWLTPGRLTELVNREASERLDADVHASNVRFTLWSTFPHLRLDIDSLRVRSRALDSLPAPLRRSLDDFMAGTAGADSVSFPQRFHSADVLLSTGHLAGGINLLKLFAGQLWLRDVEVDSLRVNLVAVADSLSNYDIVPRTGRSKVPCFRIDGLKIRGGGGIAYRSLPARTDAALRLSGASLTPRGEKNGYALRLLGKLDVKSQNLDLFRNFPVELDGDVHFRFRPFGVSTDDYRVSLGHVNGRVSFDMDLAGDSRLNKFAYSLHGFTLGDLKQFMPPGNYPILRRLDADLDLDATARLTTPYNFSSVYLPSVRVDFKVPEGEIAYTLSDRERYTLNHVGLTGSLFFDGRNPSASYVDIPDFNVAGLGAKAILSGRVTNLTTVPMVRARLRGEADLAAVSRRIAPLKPYGLSGDLTVNADVCFRADGTRLSGTILDLEASSRHASMTSGLMRVAMRGFHVRTRESYAPALSDSVLVNDIPLGFVASADAVHIDDSTDSLTFDAACLAFGGKLSRRGDGQVVRRVDARMSSDDVTLRTANGLNLRLGGLDVDLTALRMRHALLAEKFTAPARWSADARTLGFAPHTPELFSVTIPDGLRRLMSQWQPRLDLRVARGDLRVPDYPAENTLTGLDLTATFDSVTVHRVNLASGDTRGDFALRLSNLRQFLTSPVPAPLLLDVDVNLDTVQINQLARAYTDGHPHSAIARGDKAAMAAGIDTVALLLPRNLYADISARAMQTRYINLHLYDLMTHLRLGDGRLDVDTLHISADFGEAALKCSYDTGDLQQIQMSADLDVENINVVRFFQNFQKLLMMMPEMKNLSGNLSATARTHMRVFPNNYVMVPSVWADAHVRGSGLELRQDRFIHHVVRMLMIPGDGPLHIADLDIHAGVHSNLLEVFPFSVEVGDYRLVGQGLNNFDGDMYYHIGVEKWPLKIPFGINIKGHYHHPVLRFGGKGWHDGNGAGITAGVMDYDRMNVLREMRRYTGEFVHTAAVYTGD